MALTGMFGGKPDNIAHFTANVSYCVGEERWDANNKAARYAAPQRRREQSAKLRELGFKSRYFQFDRSDEKAKARAKADCEAFAREWSAKAGFELEVCEGCFL